MFPRCLKNRYPGGSRSRASVLVKEKDRGIQYADCRDFNSQRGAVLIYIVAVILIAGVLGLGIVSMTTTSTFTGLSYNPADQARYLAMSGFYYAQKNMLSEGAYPIERTLILDSGKIEIEVEVQSDNPRSYLIRSIGNAYEGTPQESRFEIYRNTLEAGPVPINLDLEDEEYWMDYGDNTDYRTGGQTDGGALIVQGETGLLGVQWYDEDGLDLDLIEIRRQAGNRLSYDLQIKTKIRPQGNNGRFYLMGLSFRLVEGNGSIESSYGLSFFRYTPTQGGGANRPPDWADTLSGFGDIQNGTPYLVLWEKLAGGNITLLDYADLSELPESFITDGELNEWVTMAVRVEEKFKFPGNETENHITAFIQQPPTTEKGEKQWDFSMYYEVPWHYNGSGTIISDSLDSTGVLDEEDEIGVHAFYDAQAGNQQFFADFGLAL